MTVNASDVIEDRIVLEAGNVQYVACIVQDSYPSNPLKDWDQSVSFYVPSWGDRRSTVWIQEQLNGENIPFDYEAIWKQPQYLRDRTTEASWYEDSSAADWLTLFRRIDPSGLYFIVQWNDSGYGDTLKFMPDDCDDTYDYAIAYRTSAQIREDHMVRRITKKVREQAEANIRVDVKTQNAYFSGDVYLYELYRQELDDDGEVLSSEEVNLWELGGDPSPEIYGYDGIADLWDAAKANAEYHHALKEEEASASFLSLDLFDAASYPEPSLSDVAGAYQARLNEGVARIGECTRSIAIG